MAAPTRIRESQILTAQVIQEIEQALGDVGRGTDFPMSRTRGGSTSSRGSANSVPPVPTRPPPVPPIPAEHRRLPQVPDVLSGDSLPLPRVRKSRSRCASAPGSDRQPGSLGPMNEGQFDHSQIPLPTLPALSPAPTPSPTPFVASWLEQEWQQEVAHQLAQPAPARWHAARAPSSPAPYLAPTYSVFPPVRSLPVSPAPPRYISSNSVTPSDLSRSSSPVWSNEFIHPVQPQDLDPNSPYGYLAPPPFFHNWETPNRTRGRQIVNSAGAHHAGYTGPPIGSRPRPAPPTVDVVAPLPVTIAAPAPATRDSTAFKTGQFTYYPVMSPYEAETALGGVGLGICEPGYSFQQAGPQLEEGDDDQPQAHARMFPLLDHDLMSAEQAAAAVAAATKVRNTIFIDRGFDVEGFNRSSSCYGDEGEVGKGARDGGVEEGFGGMRI
ncbi:hypothetical protein C8A01DRAFT_35526 [Parachaetomium inaequale]|uniref:Uncharacterized protein n=1 Tax=Parachaetomium inaequale TaxID=2588326 RepID=A0AAN6PI63_9PEZI|nr:hypothetical protein C8A01DRAFT_35526 [Parachaetomium inaequale]